MTRLDGKVAIVTGASSGIGRAAAKLFARRGARLVVNARRKAELASLVSEIEAEGGEAIAVEGDAGNEDIAARTVSAALESFGSLHIAFNNAGTLGEMGAIADISLDGWNETWRVNTTSAFLAAKYQMPVMIGNGGGSIVFTSSFVGHTAGFPAWRPMQPARRALSGWSRRSPSKAARTACGSTPSCPAAPIPR